MNDYGYSEEWWMPLLDGLTDDQIREVVAQIDAVWPVSV